MIKLQRGTDRFQYRVSGLFTSNNRVLMCRLIGYRDWVAWGLPGGRVDMMENSEDAVRREIKEEIGTDVTVNRLLWISETFFRYAEGATHEMGMCYQLSFPEGSPFEQTPEFYGNEDEYQLAFKWFDINQLHTQIVRPAFLAEKIPNIVPGVEHLVHTEYG